MKTAIILLCAAIYCLQISAQGISQKADAKSAKIQAHEEKRKKKEAKAASLKARYEAFIAAVSTKNLEAIEKTSRELGDKGQILHYALSVFRAADYSESPDGAIEVAILAKIVATGAVKKNESYPQAYIFVSQKSLVSGIVSPMDRAINAYFMKLGNTADSDSSLYLSLDQKFPAPVIRYFVEELKAHPGKNANSPLYPIMAAVTKGYNLEMVQYLVNKGASVHVKTPEAPPQNLLDLALYAEHTATGKLTNPVIEFLKRKKVKDNSKFYLNK